LEVLEKWVSEGRYDPIERMKPGSEGERRIGKLAYSNGSIGTIVVPIKVGTTYSTIVHNQQQVFGLHIPSHRPIYAYQPVTTIPSEPRGRDQMFSQYMEIVRNRYQGGHHQRTPNYHIKETLISLTTFGFGNEIVEPIIELRRLYDGFQEILALVLPPNLGFRRLVIRIPEVVLQTQTGEFSLDAVSGGIASIIDIAWQLYMYSPEGGKFVATYDEPENHLHPQLQQSFLPSLIAAFPSVQFIVASHNPFMVSSVPDSNVFVLKYDETQKVISGKLDTVNRAGSANEILRDVLGLRFTLPLWVEAKLEEIVAEFQKEEISSESLTRLRGKMQEMGLEKYVPSTIARVADARGE
jgi:hypothetical protein